MVSVQTPTFFFSFLVYTFLVVSGVKTMESFLLGCVPLIQCVTLNYLNVYLSSDCSLTSYIRTNQEQEVINRC